jgi:hypothetical protein
MVLQIFKISLIQESLEIKFGLRNYALVMSVENSLIIFTNYKLNSSQNMTLHKITNFYALVQLLS